MKTISQHRKDAKRAPKYVLEFYEGFFLNAAGNGVTENIDEALQYSVGYDNPEIKRAYWNHTFDMKFTMRNV